MPGVPPCTDCGLKLIDALFVNIARIFNIWTSGEEKADILDYDNLWI